MNKEQLINRHARNLKSLVGTGLAQDECQDIIKYAVNEALTLYDVSQKRELFYNFITWYNAKPFEKKPKGVLITTTIVEEYLKLQYSG